MEDCKESVKKGYDISDSLTKEEVYRVKVQCLTYNGKFVKLVGDGDPTRIQSVPLRPEDNGIYTYLFDQNKKLHTAKVANRFEIGSLHMTLAFLSRATRIFAAGELKKTGNNIEFNLVSGTYMLKWMRSKLEDECDDEVRQQAKELFESALPDMKITFVGEDFITDANVPVTREQLNSYLDAGFEVRLYDDEKSCKVTESILEARLRNWERMKSTGPHVEQAKSELERAKKYTLYTRAGRKRTRRNKKRSTRRKRRV